MSFELDAILRAGAAGRDGDADHFVVIADHFLALGQPRAALAALDRAYGLRPDDPNIAAPRRALLDAQAVVEHGLTFRYVPAGTFLMGSPTGEPDERPIRPVFIDEFWIAEVPMTWTRYCALMDWEPPPRAMPKHKQEQDQERRISLYMANRIRGLYCNSGEEELPGDYELDDAYQSHGDFDRKPMVAVGWPDAEALAERLSTARVRYELPSEAQWEKAARGGLIGEPYPWGSAPPDPSLCDFGHFGRWEIGESRSFPANGYGLHGMAGGVWEWTRTIYDALAYGDPHSEASVRAVDETKLHRVLRGGSWADAAATVTVSFRHALSGREDQPQITDARNPNVGFRLIRRLTA